MGQEDEVLVLTRYAHRRTPSKRGDVLFGKRIPLLVTNIISVADRQIFVGENRECRFVGGGLAVGSFLMGCLGAVVGALSAGATRDCAGQGDQRLSELACNLLYRLVLGRPWLRFVFFWFWGVMALCFLKACELLGGSPAGLETRRPTAGCA